MKSIKEWKVENAGRDMLKFSDWVSETFAPSTSGDSGEPTGVSEPQHAAEEDTMPLPSLIEKRLQMLLDEIEKKRSITRQEQLEIMKRVIEQLGGSNNPMSQAQQVSAVRDMGNQQQGGSDTPPAQPQVQ